MPSSFAIPADEAIVARARAGDLAALEALYRAYEVPVYNLARRICRTAEDAEDVLQETFLEVTKSISRYRGQGAIWAWIRKIASSKALMRLRREKYREADEYVEENVEPLSGRLASAPRGDPVHDRMDLDFALARLSDTARAVVWLHDVEGYTHEEIGELMHKTASFSKSQLARAHARLRTWLSSEGSA